MFSLGQDDIVQLKEKIRVTRSEIEEMTNKRNVSNDPMEDKLTLFRQQVRLLTVLTVLTVLTFLTFFNVF